VTTSGAYRRHGLDIVDTGDAYDISMGADLDARRVQVIRARKARRS